MNSRDVSSVAEQAWNRTKAKDDLKFSDCAVEHRGKLESAVVAVEESGNADIAGLESFEVEVKKILGKEALAIVEAKPAKVAKKKKK